MPGTYNVDIPALANLADPSAQNLIPTAAGVVRGAARVLADVTNAREETDSRKEQKRANDGSVTNNEVSLAVAREAAVVAEYNAGTYGTAVGTPSWAAQLIDQVNARFDQLDAQNNARFDQLNAQNNARFDQLNARFDQVDAHLAQASAHIQLMQAKYQNDRLLTALQFDHPLVQPVKVNAGVGEPLPGNDVVDVPPGNIGAPFPPDLAPTSIDGIKNLPRHCINALAQWANEDFGIVHGDTVEICREKLRAHYTL